MSSIVEYSLAFASSAAMILCFVACSVYVIRLLKSDKKLRERCVGIACISPVILVLSLLFLGPIAITFAALAGIGISLYVAAYAHRLATNA